MDDYAIVVPTLDRPRNIKKILELFPTAIVTVNESNVGMFRDVVPPKQLLPHPDLRLIETRNWILDNIQSDCVIQFNDDVRSLRSMVASHSGEGQKSRGYKDPEVIRAVIENTVRNATDLEIGVFCWSLTCNSSLLHPEIKPIRFVAPCSAHAFGVRGIARDRRLDTRFRGCGDYDFTLETLLKDRILLCDVRWHFDCGGMSRGKGGQSGELKPVEFDDAQRDLRKKWGRHAGESGAKQVSKKNTWRTFSVNVGRSSPLAVG